MHLLAGLGCITRLGVALLGVPLRGIPLLRVSLRGRRIALHHAIALQGLCARIHSYVQCGQAIYTLLLASQGMNASIDQQQCFDYSTVEMALK